jgi:hypothetical protein
MNTDELFKTKYQFCEYRYIAERYIKSNRVYWFLEYFKTELIQHQNDEYREKSKEEIMEYVEIFYQIRRYTLLENISPAKS